MAELHELPSADDEKLMADNALTDDWISRDGHQRRENKGVFYRRRAEFLVSKTDPDSSPMKRKSTTLYATLRELNSPEKKIITVEDPVEYRLGGVNQVQVNPKAGLTFASGLKSILRNDPDVVMIGEIRDQETAKTSV